MTDSNIIDFPSKRQPDVPDAISFRASIENARMVLIFAREIMTKSDAKLAHAMAALGDDLPEMLNSFEAAHLALPVLAEVLNAAFERVLAAADNVQAGEESPDTEAEDTDWVRSPSPVANGASWAGYDFRDYDFDLTNNGCTIGRLRLGRDVAVKLALTILALQTCPGCGLTNEEYNQMKRIAAAR